MRRLMMVLVGGAAICVHSASAKQLSGDRTVIAVLRAGALSPRQERVMIDEVRRVWGPAGIHVRWGQGREIDWNSPHTTLSVHVYDELPLAAPDAPQPLAAVPLKDGQLQPVILVSRSAVERLVLAAGVRRDSNPFDFYFGQLLGRAIAHELGHLLLNSVTHRTSGLMRQRFQARDVLAGAARFRLELQDLAAVSRLSGDVVRAARATSPTIAGK